MEYATPLPDHLGAENVRLRHAEAVHDAQRRAVCNRSRIQIEGTERRIRFQIESFRHRLVRHRKHLFKRGEIFLSYVIWYSAVRFFVEGMRTDSLYIANTIRVSQALSLILFFGAIILWIYRRKVVKPKWYLAGSGLKYPYNRD